jgi:rhodanese-related sulfurtransferase
VPTALDYSKISGGISSSLPADKSTLIVAYCGGPSCNAYTRAANEAAKLGYTNVKHLSAGISGWLQAKEQTEK